MQGEKEGKDKAKEKEKEKERVTKLAALFGAKTHTIEQDEQPSIEDTKVLFLYFLYFVFSFFCESPAPYVVAFMPLSRLCCNFDVS